MVKLDNKIESPKERKRIVEQFLAENPNPSPKYLEILADYLVLCMEKKEKKERKILTDNRLATVNKREMSFEGLAAQFENGEDGIYSLMNDSKSIIFQPKISITEQDLKDIPYLKQIKAAIEYWEQKAKTSTGKAAYIAKKAVIEFRKLQYVIKLDRKPPVLSNKNPAAKGGNFPKELDEDYSFDADGFVIPKGVSLCDPKVCSAILCDYSRLRQEGHGRFNADLYYLMASFDSISERALKGHSVYEEIVIKKIDGCSNPEVQEHLMKKFGTTHSTQYISTLWRKKIPALIASQAEDDLLKWYYTEVEKGEYKKCNRCGQIKLAHHKYFSKNKTSKDGFYSICKCCRNKRRREGS